MVEDARDERPETVRVPLDVNDDVAVILPLVRELKKAVTPFRRVVKKLVEVALVTVLFVP